MSPDTTIKAKAQELYRPSEVTTPQRMSSPSNARSRYLLRQLPTWHLSFRRISSRWPELRCSERDTPSETHRSLGRIVPSQCAGQSPIRKEKTTDPTEPAGPVLSGAKVRSRVIDIRKDLNNRRTFVQFAAEHQRACLNGITWNPATIHQPVPTGCQHLMIGNSLLRYPKDVLVLGQSAVMSGSSDQDDGNTER